MPLTRPSLFLRLRSSENTDSWKEFTATYTRVLNEYARSYGQCEHDQQDIVQNVWIILCRMMPKFHYQPARGGFRHLLRMIVKTSAIDWFRRRGSMQLSNDAVEYATSRTEPDVALDEQRNLMIRSLEMARIKSSQLAWNCFERHVMERQAAREVGRQLGLSDNAVYVNASRVLDRVRTYCIENERAAHDE